MAVAAGAVLALGLALRGPMERRAVPGSLALALLLSAVPGVHFAGVPEGLLALSALPLLWVTRAGAGRPRSERHLLGVVIAALVAAAGGARIGFLGTGDGYWHLPLALSVAATVLWVSAVVMVVELTSVVPFLVGVVAIGVALAGQYLPGAFATPEGSALAGAIVGGCVARGLLGLVPGSGGPLDRGEVLVLGHAVALLTVMSVMKGATLAGVVVPAALLAALLVLVSVGGFDRSLLLRPSPRG
jgi:hypothetical protein